MIHRPFVQVLAVTTLICMLLLVLLPAHAGPSTNSTPVPTGTLTTENVLFRDDFSTYSARWTTETSPKALAEVVDEALTLRVVSPGISTWSVPDFNEHLDHYRIQVTAWLNEGSADSFFGVVLQYQNDRHFHALMISQSGDWRFLQRDQESWLDLTPPNSVPLAPNLDIAQPYLIEVEVHNQTFSLTIDGALVAEIPSEDISSGSGFGLIAQAGKGYIDVSFDDMIVTAVLEES